MRVPHLSTSLFALSLITLATFSLTAPIQASNIVRWVDENGVTHFGNTAPPRQRGVAAVHLEPTNQADVPTSSLSDSVLNDIDASARNQISAQRSTVILKGPPEREITPNVRPTAKRSRHAVTTVLLR